MATLSGPLQRLIDALKQLPGIGPRSAERIAFHLLKTTRDEALALAAAIVATKDEIRPCTRCFNLADDELCSICADPRRDPSIIVVVEQPKDLISLEQTGLVTGVYHVLMGHIAPLDGVEPEDLTIAALLRRVRDGTPRGSGPPPAAQAAGGSAARTNDAPPVASSAAGDVVPVRELVLATNPNVEGDATALYIENALRNSGIRITRLARGLAPGASIEYANRAMLEEALRGRREL